MLDSKYLIKLENNREVKRILSDYYTPRLGRVFKAEEKKYFYDTGTGKIAEITDEVYKILKTVLENGKIQDLNKLNLTEEQLEEGFLDIFKAIKEENVLSANPVVKLTGEGVYNLEYSLSNNLTSLLLEVTEKCNLRCKYCIYNPNHPEFRDFGHRDMNIDTAIKAVNMLFENSNDTNEDICIGFYGGEPLLNKKLIKEIVEYSKVKSIEYDKNVIFAMTCNGTLMDIDTAQYIVENNFNIIFSIDGPEEIHNENRVFANGKGSFQSAIQGVKNYQYVKEKNGKEIENPLVFNMVVDGQDVLGKYTKIQNFINNNEWLPENLQILITAIDLGPEESEYILPMSIEEREITKNKIDPSLYWLRKQNTNRKEKTIIDQALYKGLERIHKRLCIDKPVIHYGMNGCCVPGKQRMYVTVDGEIYPCEKTGNIPSLGNVEKGFDIDKIKKFYIKDFINESSEYCKNCWAINLCGLCYTNCFDSDSIHYSYRHKSCIEERIYLSNLLSEYCACLENFPDIIKNLED